MVEQRYEKKSNKRFFDIIKNIEKFKESAIQNRLATENLFLNRRLILDRKEKICVLEDSLKKFSYFEVQAIGLYNLYYNLCFGTKKKDDEKNKDGIDIILYDEFAGESASFINFIDKKKEIKNFYKSKPSTPELIIDKDDLAFVGSFMALLLCDCVIYKKYVSFKAQYDNEKFKDYNYWKQIGMFCERYNDETDLKKKKMNDCVSEIPDRREIKNFFSRNYKLIIFCLVIIGGLIFEYVKN